MIKKIFICFCFCFLFLGSKIANAEKVNVSGYPSQGMNLEEFKEGLINNGYGYSLLKDYTTVGFRYAIIPHKRTYPVYLADTSSKIDRLSVKRYDGGSLTSNDDTIYCFTSDTNLYNGVISPSTSAQLFYNTSTSIKYEMIEVVYPNGVDVPEGAIPPTGELDEDITSFKWVGDGIRIYSPPDGSSIRGYKSKETVNLKNLNIYSNNVCIITP